MGHFCFILWLCVTHWRKFSHISTFWKEGNFFHNFNICRHFLLLLLSLSANSSSHTGTGYLRHSLSFTICFSLLLQCKFSCSSGVFEALDMSLRASCMLPVTSPPVHNGGFFFLCLFCRQVSYSSGWPWAHFIAKDNLKLLILLPLPHLSDGFISDSSELHKDFPGDFALFLGCLSISQSRVLPLYFFFQLKYKSYFINAMFSFFWIISLGEVPRSRISGSKGMDVFVHLSHHHLLSLWAGPTSPCFNPVRDDWLPQLFPWPWWPSNLNDCLLTPAACKCGKEASRDELSYCPRASPRLRLPLVPWCTLTGNSCTSPQSSRLREFLCSLSPTWSWDPSDSRPSPPKPGSPNTEYG